MSKSKLPSNAIVPPMSLNKKSVPSGGAETVPAMSLNKKKDGSNGGDLRQTGFRPNEKLNKVG